jgi:hypothetical protein
MSFFSQIVEGILNEIGADVAYDRYYSSIPKDEYDTIVGTTKNVDKFLRFFLDSLRDGSIEFSTLIGILNKYRSADQQIKNAVINKFNEGDYNDPYEISSDIDYWSNNGIITSKSLAKDGIDKIFEDDEWVVTCTSTYEANSHFFGDTSWCTASDRLGRYDGYKMFLRYSLNDDSIIVQITNKLKKEYYVKNKEKDSELKFSSEEQALSYARTFNGKVSSKRITYQAQYDFREKKFGMICDVLDNQISTTDLEINVGKKEMLKIKNAIVKKSEELYKKLRELFKKEEDYQESRNGYLEKRRELLWKKKKEKIEKAREYVNRCNEEKMSSIINVYKKSIKKANNVNFLKSLLKLQQQNIVTEDELKNVGYAFIRDIDYITDGYYYAIISPVLGFSKRVVYDDDVTDMSVDIEAYMNLSYLERFGNGVILVFTGDYSAGKVDDIIYSSGLIEKGPVRCYSLGNKYLSMSFSDKSYLFILKDRKLIETGDANMFFTFSRTAGKYTMLGTFDDLSDDEVIPHNNIMILYDDKKIFSGRANSVDGDFGCLHFKIGDVAYFYLSNYENNPIKIDIGSDNIYGANVYETSQGITFLEISLTNGSNIYNVDKKDFVFPEFTGSILYSKKYFGTILDGGKYLRYDYENDKYLTIDEKESKWVDCDKYGETALDKIAKKNFEKWKEQGGHSPEVQAQIDKMWADRNNTPYKTKAFDDWDEINLLKGKGLKTGSQYLKFSPSTDLSDLGIKGGPVPGWTGGVGVKDPEAFWNGADVSNSLYRIDKFGRPIDQPWNTEDEIPAIPSDRVGSKEQMREQFKSLINKLLY